MKPDIEAARIWLERQAAVKVEGIRVRSVQTKRGVFVTQQMADACEKFLRPAKRGGK